MKAFVLAGGFGSRLREVIHGRPKVLATVAGRPFLEHVLLYLKRQGITDMVLGVGYLAHFVRSTFADGQALGVSIQYSDEERPLGTAGAIKKAARLLGPEFYVLNGDTYIDLDLHQLREFHQRKEADVTIAMTKTDHGRGGLIQIDRQGTVVKFEEQPRRRLKGHYNNAGVYLLNRDVLRLLSPHEKSSLEKDLLPLLLAEGYRVVGYTTAGDYIDIGSPQHYAQAKEILKARDEDS